MLGTALSPAAETRHPITPVDPAPLADRIEFALATVRASEAHHQLLRDAQLRAFRELALLASEVSR